jgi:thiosulfate/3-mercaptopyruvate sulfurtransferase
VGFDEVALLDGGLEDWIAEGRPVSTDPAARPAGKLSIKLRPEVISYRDEVFAATDNGAASIVDAMPDAHFRGDFALYDRPGHIPGATNMPSSDLLDETGRYRSFDELEMVYDDGNRDPRVITYCGGGIAASSVAFTMHRLGFSDVAVYMNSLQEWTADPANPMTLNTP